MRCSALIRSRNAINFAYILYLRGRSEGDATRRHRAYGAALVCHVNPHQALLLEAPKQPFDFDIRQIEAQGVSAYIDVVIENELPATYWTGMPPEIRHRSFFRLQSLQPGTTPLLTRQFQAQPRRRNRRVASARGGLMPCRRWRTQSLRLSSDIAR